MIMVTYSGIKTQVRTWVSNVISIEAVASNQNAPKPPKPFFTYLINSFSKLGFDSITPPDGAGAVKYLGTREFTIMLMGFGDGVIEQMRTLQNSLQTLAVLTTFKDSGYIPFDSSPVLDVTGLDDSEYEERGSMDIFCRTDTEVEDPSHGLIEDVNIEGTVESPGNPDRIINISVDT